MHLCISSSTSIFHRAEKTVGPHAADYLNPAVRHVAYPSRLSPELAHHELTQQKEIDTLRSQNTTLRKELATLRARLAAAEERAHEVHTHLETERRERAASRSRHETERSESRARRRAIDEERERDLTRTQTELTTARSERASSTDRHRAELDRERSERAASRSRHERDSAEKDREIDALRTNISESEKALNQIRNPLLNPFATQLNIASYNWTTEIRSIDLAAVAARKATEHTKARAALPAIKGIPIFKNCTVTRSYATKQDDGRSVTGFYIKPPLGQDENTKSIILKVVHGTFSNPGVYGGNDDEKEKTNFHKSILVFAQQLSLAYKAPVKLDIFGWSGALNPDDRRTGGQTLADDIERDVQQTPEGKAPIIWVIAHSHGCNVTNNAAQFLKDKHIMIDQAILLASPIFDINPLRTSDHSYNIKSVLHLYGAADTTARAGSFETRIKESLGLTEKQNEEDPVDAGSTTTEDAPWIKYTKDTPISLLRKPQSPNSDECVRNIRVKIHSLDTDHLNIADVAIRYLGDILFTLANDFPTYYDLWVNIYDTQKAVHPKEPARWRPQFFIAKTDKTFTILHDAPQYLKLLSKDVITAFMQGLQKHETNLKKYSELYKKSVYEITRSPFTGDAGTALGYLGKELNDILYNDGKTEYALTARTSPTPETTPRPSTPPSVPDATASSPNSFIALLSLALGKRQEEKKPEEEKPFSRKLTGMEESEDTARKAATYMEAASGSGGAAGGGGKGSAPRSGTGDATGGGGAAGSDTGSGGWWPWQ